jgi:hypothetical protein
MRDGPREQHYGALYPNRSGPSCVHMAPSAFDFQLPDAR